MTWAQIDEFEALINRVNTTEWDLQRFFIQHPSFLLGSNYARLHSQIGLVRDDGTRMIPDFFLERPGTAFADIVDLKKPSAKLVSGPRDRRGLAASLTRALNQVREYREYFEVSATRREFHRRHGFHAYRPAIMVVIGRSVDYLDHLERVRIEGEYKNLQIVTYDDLLNRAKRAAVSF